MGKPQLSPMKSPNSEPIRVGAARVFIVSTPRLEELSIPMNCIDRAIVQLKAQE